MKREAEEKSQTKRCEAHTRAKRCYVAGFPYGRRGHKPRNGGSHQKVEKKGIILP